MNTREIRRDEHGLYVRLSGHVYRPEITKWTREDHPSINDTASQHEDSDRVDASVVSRTSLAKVGGEIWHDHGPGLWTDYRTGKKTQIPSKYVWKAMSRGPLTESLLRGALKSAKGIAWEGCHKIYVLMDDEQVHLQRDVYGYGDGKGDSQFHLVGPSQAEQEQAFQTVKDWYDESCSLRFINGVRTDRVDPNAGFFDIVAQCDDWVDEIYAEI